MINKLYSFKPHTCSTVLLKETSIKLFETGCKHFADSVLKNNSPQMLNIGSILLCGVNVNVDEANREVY